MSLRDAFTAQLKTAMLARDAPRVSVIRMITARLKDVDIAARPKGITAVPDEEVIAMLRGMVKSRRESVELYRQGNRAELAAKEESEIAVIEAFLPRCTAPFPVAPASASPARRNTVSNTMVASQPAIAKSLARSRTPRCRRPVHARACGRFPCRAFEPGRR